MNEPAKPFALTREEKNSQLWRKLAAHWQAKIDILLAQLERDQPENATARLRGRLAECHANLSLAIDKPIID